LLNTEAKKVCEEKVSADDLAKQKYTNLKLEEQMLTLKIEVLKKKF
jgi:hypothetical protein